MDINEIFNLTDDCLVFYGKLDKVLHCIITCRDGFDYMNYYLQYSQLAYEYLIADGEEKDYLCFLEAKCLLMISYLET